jgi:hypothetical protein
MGWSDKGAGRLNVWRRGAKRHFPVYKHALSDHEEIKMNANNRRGDPAGRPCTQHQ